VPKPQKLSRNFSRRTPPLAAVHGANAFFRSTSGTSRGREGAPA
jgi:hypothetical protein